MEEIDKIQIATLFVDKTRELASEFSTKYAEVFDAGEIEFANSLLKGIEYHNECTFDLCVVSNIFELPALAEFIQDYKKIEKPLECIFVVLEESIPEDYNFDTYTNIGFATVISKLGTYRDKERLKSALEPVFRRSKISQKILDVDQALSLIFKEIDKVAKDRKRGRNTQIDTFVTDFVTMQTTFDDQVLDSYYQNLSNQAEKADPDDVSKISVPESVLKKNLPHLSNETYVGASSRVWNKLSNKFGVKSDGTKLSKQSKKTDQQND